MSNLAPDNGCPECGTTDTRHADYCSRAPRERFEVPAHRLGEFTGYYLGDPLGPIIDRVKVVSVANATARVWVLGEKRQPARLVSGDVVVYGQRL